MSKVTSFIIGGLVGAGIAMLFAPKPGEQTRAIVAEKANAVWGEAVDFGAGMPDSAKDLYKTAREKASALLKDTPGVVQDFANEVQSKTSDFAEEAPSQAKDAGKPSDEAADELREKIEAARKRIAEQVMQNAEQSKIVDVIATGQPQAENGAQA